MSDQPYELKEYDGTEVGEMVNAMTRIFAGAEPLLMMSACLSLALLISEPDLDGEHISKGVQELSEWIALYTDSCVAPVTVAKAN